MGRVAAMGKWCVAWWVGLQDGVNGVGCVVGWVGCVAWWVGLQDG